MSPELMTGDAARGVSTLAQQRNRWLSQAASVPSLQCGKEETFPRALELLRQIRDGEVTDLGAVPTLRDQAPTWTWRQFGSALRTLGVVENRRGVLHLTTEGEALLSDGSRERLATLLAERVRLVAEAMGLLVHQPLTVEEVNRELVESFNLEWKTVNNTRARLTWLEVLGLVEWLGDRKLTATSTGRVLYGTWETVSPSAVTNEVAVEAGDLPSVPSEISALLDRLEDAPAAQDERKTYNIWVPSPSSDPSKIQNMRTCIDAASSPIEKEELLTFIADRFGLRRSSVDSMLPFMRAGGFLQEVRRGVFIATPAAKAWLGSGSDIDFIRILHGNLRFVGELLRAASENTPRNAVYQEGARYGMNKDKIRWLIAFMIEAGLLIDTSWSSVEATRTGRQLMETLPLAEPPASRHAPAAAAPRELPGDTLSASATVTNRDATAIARQLQEAATDPAAQGRASGAAFEASIERAFKHLGFKAQRISGSGDTDVLVQWYDGDQVLRTAIVDAKSTSSGQISHTNVSDVAISTHKEKNAADYVAIVAPAFAGETIRQMAAKRAWALVTASELAQIVVAAESVGLRPAEVGNLFSVPDGVSRVAEMIEARQRDLDMVSLVVSRLKDEVENEEAVSPRDISLIERNSVLAPSIDELISTFDLLSSLDVDIVRVVDQSSDAKHETYQIGDAKPAANWLRALASAIDSGASPSRSE